MNWFELTGLLTRQIAFHRIFATVGGGACCGLFLSQAYYWTPRTKDPDGWFYKSQVEWEQETALTRYEQETIRKRLKERGLIEEKKEDIPCKLFYRINKDNLLAAIAKTLESADETFAESQVGEKQQTSCGESNEQAAVKATNILYTETTPEITHTRGVSEEKTFGFGFGSSTGILVASSSNHEQKSEELQIVSVGQASAAIPISPTTRYIPTREEEAANFGRRIVVKKGTYASRSTDPWMNGINPKQEFVLWRYHCSLNDQKNLKDGYRPFTASEENAHSEICDNYVRAGVLWKKFLEEMHQRVEIHNSRVAAGIPIAPEEQAAIASIAPYTNLSLALPPVAIEPAKAAPAIEPVAAPPQAVEVPKGAINPTAYKVFVAQAPPSEEEINKGRELFIQQRIKKFTADNFPSMPKAKFIDTPTTDFAKYHNWLHSGEPGLRTEAITWAKSHANDLDIDYDENGSIIDFEEVQF